MGQSSHWDSVTRLSGQRLVRASVTDDKDCFELK